MSAKILAFRESNSGARRATQNNPTPGPHQRTPEPRSDGTVPVLDHADAVIDWVGPDEAARLLTDSRNTRIGTRSRLRAVRLGGPDPGELLLVGSRHTPDFGTPHQRESYWNPRGVWTLDRIPERFRDDFRGVVLDCIVPETKKAA